MTGGAGQAIDPGGEARGVLRSAVADYGARVLSNAAILEGICEDRLPDSPREASLVSIAARADVSAMLEQQAGGVGPDTAVRLTAAALAESRSIDPAAAIWVVGEFARALGFQVSDGLQPAVGAAPAAPAPAAPAPAAPAPGVAGALPGAVPDAGPAAGISPPVSPPGEDLTVPPTGLPHPPTQQGFGHQETVTTGQGAPQPGLQPGMQPGAPAVGGYGWTPSPAGQSPGAPMAPPGGPVAGAPMAPPGGPVAGAPMAPPGGPVAGAPMAPPGGPVAGAPMAPPGGPAGPGGGYMGPPGARPPGTRHPRRQLMLWIGVGVLVVIVFIVVVVSQSTGSGKNAGAGPTATPSHSSHPTPSTSTSFQPTSGDLTLESLIPPDVSANHACTPVHQPAFGATAEMHCTGAPNIPAGYVQYYLFASTANMNNAYSTFLSDFANTHKDTGRCHQINGTSAFSKFSPCETQFSFASTAEGRIAEYNYKGNPDISCTFSVDKVLVDMQGTDGNTLITWWDQSHNWINS